MIQKYYYVNPKIYEVKVERTTQHSVWISGNRRARFTEYEKYYDTFEEAKQKLIERYTHKVNYHSKELDANTKTLEYINNLTESDTDSQ